MQNLPHLIKEQYERLHSLLEHLSIGVVYHGPNEEVIDANPIALEVLGLSLDQIKGKTAFDPDWKTIHEA